MGRTHVVPRPKCVSSFFTDLTCVGGPVGSDLYKRASPRLEGCQAQLQGGASLAQVSRMISHRHRCLFTHVPKTGGKSVLAAFGLPMLGADYDGSLAHIEQPYGHRRLTDWEGKDAFCYFKFAFVRNPWDRLVSAFSYLNAGGCNQFDADFRAQHLDQYNGDFLRFVDDLERLIQHQHFRPQSHWLCNDEGQLLADFIGRFESMEADYQRLAERLGLSAGHLPLLNTSVHAAYTTCYDAARRDRVAALYENDIAMFGYDFDH